MILTSNKTLNPSDVIFPHKHEQSKCSCDLPGKVKIQIKKYCKTYPLRLHAKHWSAKMMWSVLTSLCSSVSMSDSHSGVTNTYISLLNRMIEIRIFFVAVTFSDLFNFICNRDKIQNFCVCPSSGVSRISKQS